MAKKTIAQLTTEFGDGKTVSGSNFANIFDSNFNLAETGTSTAEGSLFLKGNLTANEYILSSSVINQQILDVSGSTHFGDSSDDVHTRIGSMMITGSLTISGSSGFQFRVDSDDVVLGADAGKQLDSSATSYNVLIGHEAGYDLTSGDKNVFIGQQAGGNGGGTIGPNGTFDVAIGYRAMGEGYVKSGNGNVMLGYEAGSRLGYAGSGAGNNVAIGYQAGQNIKGYNNVAVGLQALYGVQTGNGANWNNIGIGREAGKIYQGYDSIFIGYLAGNSATTGNGNILIGTDVDLGSATDSGIMKIGSGSIIPLSASLVTGDVKFPSTASAAYFVGDGSQLTNLPSSSPFPLSGSAIISSSFTAGDTNSNALKVIASGSVSGSGIVEFVGSAGTLFSAVDSLSGSLMAVTDASGIPILEVFSDATVEAKGFKGYRPIETRAASFVLQLGDMGTYNRCGSVTVSLSASSAIPFEIGTEIEFFQTSSAGNLLITASAGSGITLNSKDGNLKLAGQFSAATLKKVGTNEWDLVGDLTS